MSKHTGSCRSCKAPVIWVETEATDKKPGSKMPLDADAENPTKALRVDNGNIVNTGQTTSDGVYVVRYVPKGKGKFVSHFATCPNAKDHRR